MRYTRLFALVLALALVAGACGGDDATADSGQVTVPDVVGDSADFARGALEAVGLVPDVIELDGGDAVPGIVFEQVPAAGSSVAAGATVVVKVAADDGYTPGDDEETTTTAAVGDTTTTTVAATTTTTPGTTTTGVTTTTTATTTTAAGITQQECQAHPYYDSQNDPNCVKARYETPVNSTTSPRVWQCLSTGAGPYYNQDQPGNIGCLEGRNKPVLYYQANPPAKPYPDYDPTVGTVDTFLECAWRDAQHVLDRVDNLSQGQPQIQGGYRWIVSTDNKVCAGP